MFNHAYSNVVRTFACAVGALAVSSVFLFAAAGPARADTTSAVTQLKIIDVVSTSSSIAY